MNALTDSDDAAIFVSCGRTATTQEIREDNDQYWDKKVKSGDVGEGWPYDNALSALVNRIPGEKAVASLFTDEEAILLVERFRVLPYICRTIILHLVVQDNHDWVTAKEIQQYPWMGELKAETITQHMQHAAKKSNLEPSDSISQTSDSFVEYDKMGSVCYDHMSHSLQHLLVALDQRGRTALAADFKYLRKPDPTIKDRKAREEQWCTKFIEDIGKQKALFRKDSTTSRLKDLAGKKYVEKFGYKIRLNPQFTPLLRRLCIIVERRTCPPKCATMLLPAVIRHLNEKRGLVFSGHQCEKPEIPWTNRSDILQYEEALDLEQDFKTLLREMAQPKPKAKVKGKGKAKADSVQDEVDPQQRLTAMINESIIPRFRECVSYALLKFMKFVPLSACFEAGHVYARMTDRIAVFMKQQGHRELEKEYLDQLLSQRRWYQHRRASWFLRRAHVLLDTRSYDGLGQLQEMLDEIYIFMNNEETPVAQHAELIRLLLRLQDLLDIPNDSRYQEVVPLKQHPKVTIKAGTAKDADGPTSSKSSEAVRAHYEQPGEDDIVCIGNTLLPTLFGLLFREVIFANVPGVFCNKFQAAPFDLTDETFNSWRKGPIHQRLKIIKEGGAKDLVSANYDPNIFIIGVEHDLHAKEELMDFCETAGPAILMTICRMLSDDYMKRKIGMPDVVIWNKESSLCKFVCTLSDDEDVQESQKVWLDALHLAKAKTEFLSFKLPVKKSKRKRGTTVDSDSDDDFAPASSPSKKRRV